MHLSKCWDKENISASDDCAAPTLEPALLHPPFPVSPNCLVQSLKTYYFTGKAYLIRKKKNLILSV